MPKNIVSDLITDQEMAFARLILSGGMTDRLAAESAGLSPDSAAYTKSKPLVRAYMLEHRAAVEEKLVQQEADGLHRLSLDREQVLARLWELANLSPEMTRNSVTGQVKALSMIVAMQNFIPDRKALSEKNSPTLAAPQIHASPWRAGQQATTMEHQPNPDPAQQEGSPACPACPGLPWKPERAPGSPAPARRGAEEAPLDPGPGQSAVATLFSPSEPLPRVPDVPILASVPDTRAPWSIKRNPFVHPH